VNLRDRDDIRRCRLGRRRRPGRHRRSGVDRREPATRHHRDTERDEREPHADQHDRTRAHVDHVRDPGQLHLTDARQAELVDRLTRLVGEYVDDDGEIAYRVFLIAFPETP
jgi:hypothetical protein